MKRIVLLLSISVLATVILAIVHLAEAQQVEKVYRIGLLTRHSSSDHPQWYQAFRQGLRDLGWVEGKNILIESRWAAGRRERFPILAEELLRLNVELVVTVGGAPARVVQRASKTIPIVMAEATAPVERGLVQSLARPGGNTTGLSARPPELFGKMLELLKDTVPNLSRVAVLWSPKGPASRLGWNQIQLPARKLGIQLHSMEVRSPKDFDKGFEDAIKARAGALVITPFGWNRKRIADLAAKSRLPAIDGILPFVDAGGLMSYGTNFADLFRRAATYVDKILKGAKPADLPIEQPRKFDLAINLKTAKALGLTVPPEVLLQATRVIK